MTSLICFSLMFVCSLRSYELRYCWGWFSCNIILLRLFFLLVLLRPDIIKFYHCNKQTKQICSVLFFFPFFSFNKTMNPWMRFSFFSLKKNTHKQRALVKTRECYLFFNVITCWMSGVTDYKTGILICCKNKVEGRFNILLPNKYCTGTAQILLHLHIN